MWNFGADTSLGAVIADNVQDEHTLTPTGLRLHDTRDITKVDTGYRT